MPNLPFGRFLLAACLLLPAFESKATAALAPLQPVETPTSTGIVVPANTIVELEMVDTVSSVTSKRGDFFKLRVAVEVKSGEQVLIPAGTPVVGQVVHAAAAGAGGKSGELILAARYVELPQGPVKLRGSFGAAGKDRVGVAVATWLVGGPFGMMVRGKESVLPAGSALSARIANNTPIISSP